MVDLETVEQFLGSLSFCKVCPLECGVNRLQGERGRCGAGFLPEVASYHPHFGEESILSGWGGSGTIFFSGCNMKCVYCQNYSISQLGEGEAVSVEDLARIMLALEHMGCHNVNLVSPSHFAPQILKALYIAREEGLGIPIVYNTGGYDKLETLKLFRGVVNIYLPDMRYASEESALRYSGVPNYPKVNRQALVEMFKQVGEVMLLNGIAVKGLIIRILLIPSLVEEALENLRFIAENISKKVHVTLMRQYRPVYKVSAGCFPELNSFIDDNTYRKVVRFARELGLSNLILQ
ncbi:MAG: putative pyruvate formate lyase activating enzyme [Candidatus Atribacteria bacterium]|jgi:putative pyruvate formate lyase activating enzyme|uniref:radical SAM protein n=1 Tax=Atrimonas thermophila TaxID=3064161 RepID=UPI0024AA5A04|nr:putative pyruvate formate lyase activating enzyme [Candidatus Atribacteria bacterium]